MQNRLPVLCLLLLLAGQAVAQQEGAKDPAVELSEQAQREYTAKNYLGAAELYQDIIRKYPNHEMVQAGTIQLRLMLNLRFADLTDQAGREAKKFIDSFPEHREIAEAYFTLGVAYEHMGEAGGGLDKAREAYLKAMETERDSQRLQSLKSRLASLDQKVAEDATAQRQLTQSNPDRVVIINDPLPSEEGLPRKADLESYVILTDIPQGDPYYAAVDRLAKLRKAKAIVTFAPDKLGELSGRLRELSPEFVCVVAKPATIDCNLACRLLELSTGLDSDPFPDFVFGIITGETADEAEQFVKNIAKTEKRRSSFPKKLIHVIKSSTSDVEVDSDQWATGFVSLTIRYASRAFLQQHMDKLEEDGIIMFRGTGSPQGVVDGIDYKDIAYLDLSPAVVFSAVSYSGITSRGLSTSNQSYRVVSEDLDPAKSFCLRVIASGVCGYIAPLGPINSSITCLQEIEEFARSAGCLGHVMKRTQDGLVLARRESVLAIQPLVVNQRRPPETVLDGLVHAAASRVLYGDPALKPLAHGIGWPTSVSVRRRADGFRVTCRRAADEYEYARMDAYRFSGESGKRRSNDQLRVVFELPKGFDKDIKAVEVENQEKDQVLLKPSFVTCLVEKWGGKRLVHLQVDFPPLSLRTKAFDVSMALRVEK
ncbi:MAG: outer membrane protein assembly factor BamD [Candidatus Eisenbacteria bacterium]|nr:outer membrane protein assembly factor BamD [Candidatus Eisenbacteria bacterium]